MFSMKVELLRDFSLKSAIELLSSEGVEIQSFCEQCIEGRIICTVNLASQHDLIKTQNLLKEHIVTNKRKIKTKALLFCSFISYQTQKYFDSKVLENIFAPYGPVRVKLSKVELKPNENFQSGHAFIIFEEGQSGFQRATAALNNIKVVDKNEFRYSITPSKLYLQLMKENSSNFDDDGQKILSNLTMDSHSVNTRHSSGHVNSYNIGYNQYTDVMPPYFQQQPPVFFPIYTQRDHMQYTYAHHQQHQLYNYSDSNMHYNIYNRNDAVIPRNEQSNSGFNSHNHMYTTR